MKGGIGGAREKADPVTSPEDDGVLAWPHWKPVAAAFQPDGIGGQRYEEILSRVILNAEMLPAHPSGHLF
jgi:hypothetical protein